MNIQISDKHSESVTLRRYRVNDAWWQFYDNNSTSHQVCKLEYDFYGSGEDVWVHEGYVDVPSSPSDTEREEAYIRFLTSLYEENSPQLTLIYDENRDG